MVTLLDYLPSLRRAAPQRIAAEEWPHTTAVDDLGRLCVGGLALTDAAAEFGTPVDVLDETDLRQRLRRYRAGSGDMVPVLTAAALPTTVMRWIDDEGLGLAIRRGIDLAAALAGGVNTTRMVLHARGLSHDDLLAGAAAAPGRIVVESTMDVAYLCGTTRGPQRVLVGAIEDAPDPELIERVLRDPLLELVGLHCRPTDDVERSVRSLLSSMKAVLRTNGKLMTEVHLTIDSETGPLELAAETGEALENACAATRLPRPRLVVEPRWPVLSLAGVTVYRVASVAPSVTGSRIIVDVDAAVTASASNGVVALANRHPLSRTERVTVVAGDVEIARNIELACGIHAGDVLAVTRACGLSTAPLVAVHRGVTSALTRRMTIADALARDLGYSARHGHDEHLGGQDPHRHALARSELPRS
jgi:diaminopimelate decarboxylase